MRIEVLIFSLLLISCSRSREYMVDEHREKLLGEQIDGNGRLTKRVVTGIIPGEDTYLTITKYDSLGRVIEEYGAKPYGAKFKRRLKYNSDNNIIEELNYRLSAHDAGLFENYQPDGFYELKDTLVSFDGVVDARTLFTYEGNDSVVIQHHYILVYDSVTNRNAFELFEVDTVDIRKNAR